MPATQTKTAVKEESFIPCPESHEPNEETAAVLRDCEAGRNLLGPYDSIEEMFRDFGIDIGVNS
jgi:hypothetical protein